MLPISGAVSAIHGIMVSPGERKDYTHQGKCGCLNYNYVQAGISLTQHLTSPYYQRQLL